jgi:hypothetical protein
MIRVCHVQNSRVCLHAGGAEKYTSSESSAALAFAAPTASAFLAETGASAAAVLNFLEQSKDLVQQYCRLFATVHPGAKQLS